MIFLSLFLAITFLFSSSLLAENVAVLDYPFKVDSITPVDATSVTISVLGQNKLIKKDQLESEVVGLYLSSPMLYKKVSYGEFIEFLKRARDQKHSHWVELAVLNAFSNSSISDNQLANLIEEIASDQSGSEVIKNVLLSLPKDIQYASGLCACLVNAGINDPSWVQEKASRLLFKYQETCEDYLGKRYITLLQNGEIEKAPKLAKFFAISYGVDSEAYKKIGALNARADRLVEATKDLDIQKLLSVIKASPSEKDEYEVLKPLALSLLSDFITNSIEQKHCSDALEALTALDFSKRTPQHHQLVLSALSCQNASEKNAVLSSEVFSMLRAYAFKDDAIRGSLEELLEKSIRSNLQSNDFTAALRWFNQLVLTRSDPNQKNDLIRCEIIDALNSAGYNDKAKEILVEVGSGVPLGYKVKFALQGLYVNRSLVIIMIFLVLGICAVPILSKFFPIIEGWVNSKYSKKSEEIDDKSWEGDSTQKKFVSVSRAPGMSYGSDEYTICLNFFGLALGADLAEIKLAYRNAVKGVHPDLNPNAGPKEMSKFVELRKTYEKLLKLHADRTGER